MVQQQSQSHFSRVQSANPQEPKAESGPDESSQGPSLSPPAAPDATSPYRGPGDANPPAETPERVADEHGPEEMEQPYFSEAQSTLAAFAPAKRVGDSFPEPEDPRSGVSSLAEQSLPASGSQPEGAPFATALGTIRAGMQVVDSYGRAIGAVAGVEDERLRLASNDSHADGVSFVPLSLVEGIDGDRVLLGGRGDASFGQPTE